MKKRALSMLLALALCFTVFSGVTNAAKLTVDRALDSIGGVLDSMDNDVIQQAQKAKLNEIATNSPALADDAYVGTDAADADAAWAEIADVLMKDEAFMSTTPETEGDKNSAPMFTIYPYFLLRYCQENGTENPVLAEAVNGMAALDQRINTSGKGIREALKDFTPYGNELTNIFTDLLSDENLEALIKANVMEDTPDGYVFVADPAVLNYARNAIFDSVVSYAEAMAASQGSEEVDAAYDAFMNTKEGDIAKKNIALFIGLGFMEKAVNGGFAKYNNYVKANIGDIVGKIGASVPNLFSADKTVAVGEAQNVAKGIVSDAINSGLVDDLLAELVAKDLNSHEAAIAAYDLLVNAVDAADVDASASKELYQTILLDVIFNRCLDVYNADGSAVTSVKEGKGVKLQLYHRALKTRFGVDTHIEVNPANYTVKVLTDNITAEKTPTGFSFKWKGGGAPPANIEFRVYRGGDEIADADIVDPASAVNIGRYIKTFIVPFENPMVDTDGKTITLNNTAKAQYTRGEKIAVSGSLTGNWQQVVIAVADPDGNIAIERTGVAPTAFENGTFTFTLDETHKLGTYTIYAGETTLENSENSARPVTFELVDKLVGEKSANTSKYAKKGTDVDDVLAKFADKSKPLTVTLAKNGADGKVETTVFNYRDNPELFDMTAVRNGYDPQGGKQTFEVGYSVPESFGHFAFGGDPVKGYQVADGKVEVTVTRSNGGGGGGGGSGTTKSITLDRKDLKDEYAPGEAITITGTTRGYSDDDMLTVTVTGPDGTKTSFEISVKEFHEGYDLRLVEPGTYTIDVEGERFTVVITGVTSEIFDKDNHTAYIIGYEDGSVRPEANISREEVTTILFRAIKDEYRQAFNTESTDAYSDVEADRWSMNAIATLNRIGIIKGYEDNTFRPGRAITRAEFAALISRLADVNPAAPVVVPSYTDVDGHWAADSIYTATAEGWFLGDDTGTFRPDDRITRAEAVTVINRILERDKVTIESFGQAELAKFSDLASDAWYYVNMVEATNGHNYTKDEEGNETWTAEAAEADEAAEGEAAAE